MSVVVFRSQLLPYSETFIRAQYNSLPLREKMLVGLEELGEPPSPYVILRRRDAIAVKLGLRSAELSQYCERASAVLAHFAQDGWRVSNSLPKRQALYVYCHGSDVLTNFDHLRKRGPSFAALVRNWSRLVERATGFIAASEFIAQRLRELGVPKEKVRVNYVGVRLPPVTAVEPGSNAHARTTVLFVGRLIESKGARVLCEAFRHIISPKVPQASLKIVGDGPERGTLEPEFSDPKIQFLGRRTEDDVRSLMRAGALVVAPSKRALDGSSEGLNQVVIEAQSFGNPVVACRTGGLPEAVGPTERLVNANDVMALGEGCVKVMESDEVWSAQARTMRRRFVAERFDIEKQTLRLSQAILEGAS